MPGTMVGGLSMIADKYPSVSVRMSIHNSLSHQFGQKLNAMRKGSLFF